MVAQRGTGRGWGARFSAELRMPYGRRLVGDGDSAVGSNNLESQGIGCGRVVHVQTIDSVSTQERGQFFNLSVWLQDNQIDKKHANRLVHRREEEICPFNESYTKTTDSHGWRRTQLK